MLGELQNVTPQTWVSFLSGMGLLLVCCNAKRGEKNPRGI